MKLSGILLLSSFFLVGCGTGPAVRDDARMVVKDVRIPDGEPLPARFARHTWVDYRGEDGGWRRMEIVNKDSGLIHKEIAVEEFQETSRWGRKVVVLGQLNGVANPDDMADLARFARGYETGLYRAYPGPNSNTFAQELIRKIDGLDVVMDHNAIGKEWGWHLGRSAGGAGVEVQTPLAGMALGLREGVELSLFGFSGGVSLFPPAVKIPVLPPLPRW